MRFSAPLTGHALVNRETDVPYKGFKGPFPSAEQLGRALEARLDFGRLDRPLEVKLALCRA